MSPETRDLLSVLLIVLAAMDVAVTLILVQAAQRLDEPALTERASSAVVLTAVACLGAFLGVVSLTDNQLPSPVATLVIVGCFVLVSVPQYVWWLGYRLGRFR